MTRASTWILMGLVAASSLAPGVGRAEPRVIRIGAVQPMSGSYSSLGQESEPAFEWTIKKINAEGGIKSMGGAKLEVILADDASNPSRTVAEVRRLASQQDVSVIVGGILTGQMMALAPALDELKVPTLSLWAGMSRSPYIFSMGFPYDRGYAQTMADFAEWLAKEKGFRLKTVALVYSNYEAGQQINKLLAEHLKAKGFTVVGEVPLDVKAQDQTAAVLRLRALKPDLVAGLAVTRDGHLLLKARHNLNYHDPVFVGGSATFADSSMWQELGPEVADSVLPRNLFPMTGFSPASDVPAVKKLVKELQEAKIGKAEVGMGAAQGAQAARIVQRVLELAASTDPQKILAAFHRLDIGPGDPDLYLLKTGGVSFNEERVLRDARGVVVQWTPDRRQEILFPPQFATGVPRRFTP